MTVRWNYQWFADSKHQEGCAYSWICSQAGSNGTKYNHLYDILLCRFMRVWKKLGP